MIWLATPVLLAVLLIVPPRTWWLYVVALLPVHLHLVLTFQGPVPLAVMLAQWGGNCAHAVLVGVVLRPLLGVPPRLVGLRNMLLFILVACFVSSFLVSAVVVFLFQNLGWTPDFWLPWRGRSLTNAVGSLVMTPLVLWMITDGARDLREASPRRYLEFAVLATLLLVVGLTAFGESSQRTGGSLALLYAPLPLLLWAAVRFDMPGLCVALIAIGIASVSNAIAGRGPFTQESPVESALDLQLFLFAIAIPLLLLSALIREHRETLLAVRTAEAAVRSGYDQIRNLATRLVSAQEAERRRIARELHDGLCQELTALSIDVELLPRNTPGSKEWAAAVRDVYDRARRISRNVHDLSHELHPFRMETLGLIAAIRGTCEEVAGQHGVAVSFEHRDVPATIHPDVALSLYRIVQEALRNVVKHSGAGEARVALIGTPDALDLQIADHGAGFTAHGMSLAGIGLMSMRERAGSAGGTMAIDTAPGAGTRIDITIPLRGRAPDDPPAVGDPLVRLRPEVAGSAGIPQIPRV